MTTTRWKVVTLPSGYIPSICTDDERGIHITHVAGASRTDTQDLENAHQIVREHNAHEELTGENDLLRHENFTLHTQNEAMREALEAGIKLHEYAEFMYQHWRNAQTEDHPHDELAVKDLRDKWDALVRVIKAALRLAKGDTVSVR